MLLALSSLSAVPLSPNLLPGKLQCFIRTWGQSFPYVLPMGLGRVLGVLMLAAAESQVYQAWEWNLALVRGLPDDVNPQLSDEEGIASGLEAKFGHFLAMSYVTLANY